MERGCLSEEYESILITHLLSLFSHTLIIICTITNGNILQHRECREACAGVQCPCRDVRSGWTYMHVICMFYLSYTCIDIPLDLCPHVCTSSPVVRMICVFASSRASNARAWPRTRFSFFPLPFPLAFLSFFLSFFLSPTNTHIPLIFLIAEGNFWLFGLSFVPAPFTLSTVCFPFAPSTNSIFLSSGSFFSFLLAFISFTTRWKRSSRKRRASTKRSSGRSISMAWSAIWPCRRSAGMMAQPSCVWERNTSPWRCSCGLICFLLYDPCSTLISFSTPRCLSLCYFFHVCKARFFFFKISLIIYQHRGENKTPMAHNIKRKRRLLHI